MCRIEASTKCLTFPVLGENWLESGPTTRFAKILAGVFMACQDLSEKLEAACKGGSENLPVNLYKHDVLESSKRD
jgi:hypothetical protein